MHSTKYGDCICKTTIWKVPLRFPGNSGKIGQFSILNANRQTKAEVDFRVKYSTTSATVQWYGSRLEIEQTYQFNMLGKIIRYH